MKAICFYFQIHQPFRLKNYRFFNIGNDHYYYDDFANDEIITRIAHRSYLPANQTLLEMINASNKQFKVAFSISGTALEQLEQYVPEFIESMKELVATGCVEFLSETYAIAFRTCTERGIEREEPWFDFRNGDAAIRAAVFLTVYLAYALIMILYFDKAIRNLESMFNSI